MNPIPIPPNFSTLKLFKMIDKEKMLEVFKQLVLNLETELRSKEANVIIRIVLKHDPLRWRVNSHIVDLNCYIPFNRLSKFTCIDHDTIKNAIEKHNFKYVDVDNWTIFFK